MLQGRAADLHLTAFPARMARGRESRRAPTRFGEIRALRQRPLPEGLLRGVVVEDVPGFANGIHRHHAGMAQDLDHLRPFAQ